MSSVPCLWSFSTLWFNSILLINVLTTSTSNTLTCQIHFILYIFITYFVDVRQKLSKSTAQTILCSHMYDYVTAEVLAFSVIDILCNEQVAAKECQSVQPALILLCTILECNPSYVSLTLKDT